MYRSKSIMLKYKGYTIERIQSFKLQKGFLHKKGGHILFKILVSDPISDFGLKQLMDADDVEVVKETGLSEDELVSKMSEFDALLVRSQTKVTERIKIGRASCREREKNE